MLTRCSNLDLKLAWACRCGLPAGRLAQLAATAAELEREAARWQQSSQACSTLFKAP